MFLSNEDRNDPDLPEYWKELENLDTDTESTSDDYCYSEEDDPKDDEDTK